MAGDNQFIVFGKLVVFIVLLGPLDACLGHPTEDLKKKAQPKCDIARDGAGAGDQRKDLL
jgi:hypothetical protein